MRFIVISLIVAFQDGLVNGVDVFDGVPSLIVAFLESLCLVNDVNVYYTSSFRQPFLRGHAQHNLKSLLSVLGDELAAQAQY